MLYEVITPKVNLMAALAREGRPFASAMGTAGRLAPERLKVGRLWDATHCPLASDVRKRLRRLGFGPPGASLRITSYNVCYTKLLRSDTVVFDSVAPVASVTGVTVSAGNAGYAILNSVITLTISVAEGTSGMATAPSASIRNASDALIADMAVSGPTGTGPYVYT